MKQRAALLIGVHRTGQLAPLRAVAPGVASILAWAQAQPGFRDGAGEHRITALTDTDAPVTAQAIRSAVKRFVDMGTIEQLFVYFAGHGVNMRFSEYWLLSGAPDDPNEAVNVRSSADLARYCGIPHVVFISDACRTAADSIQAQAVEGTVIFPNPGPNTEPGCVDLFYASMVGKPALEVRDPAAAAKGFEAIYTTALVRGLDGSAPELIDQADSDGRRIRPWPLKHYLQREVPKLLEQRGVALTITQKPDAIITSEPQAWLAELPQPSVAAPFAPPPPAPAPAAPSPGGTSPPAPSPGAPLPAPAAPQSAAAPASAPATRSALPRAARAGADERSLADIAQQALKSALGGDGAPAAPARARRSASPSTRLFDAMTERLAATPPPHHFETRCGFELHGVSAAMALGAGTEVERIENDRRLRVHCSAGAVSVLIIFADGYGALLPAIAGYIGALTYDAADHELTSVEYEPSNNTPLYQRVASSLPEVRNLRRLAGAAAAHGSFRLPPDVDPKQLLAKVLGFGAIDPALSVYAAHALHDAGRLEPIVQMVEVQRRELHVALFDVAMLAQRPRSQSVPLAPDVYPPVPLLAQGWGVLAGFGVELPRSLGADKLGRHVTDSLWTLFDPTGVALLRDALAKGEIR